MEIFLETFARGAGIVDALAAKITPDQLALKVADGEMDIAGHLCHIHGTRRWWVSQIDASRLEGTERLYTPVGDDWEPIRDLELIRARLPESANLVLAITREALAAGAGRIGPYENPARFMQHMLFHEGWHVGAILAALRVNGQELPEEWEELNIWAQWRDPEI